MQGILSCAGLIALVGSTAAMAAQPVVRIDTQMFVERVTTDINGRARRTLAGGDRASPGDNVIVILNWRNDSPRPVRSLAASRSLLRGTAPDLNDSRLEVSIDGGQHWARFDRIWLPTPLGGVRRALPEEVTHVRWLLPDAASPGQGGRLSYRATLR